MIYPATAVVFDINVYLDYILGDDGIWPLLPEVPPTTGNAAADAVSLAFASRFRLFASPQVLQNTARVMRQVGQTEETVRRFVAAVVDRCEFSGGAVIEPVERDHGVADYEDNLIVSLAKSPAVDALVVVTIDSDLLELGPDWHGRLIMRPGRFVEYVVAR